MTSMKRYTLTFDDAQIRFLRELIDNPQVSVPVKNATVAGAVHTAIMSAPECEIDDVKSR